MTPRVRRPLRVNQLPDSESEDDEDVRVVSDSMTNDQPIDLSDDEDHNIPPPPPRFPIPQQVPAARQLVEELLHSKGVKPRTQWLQSCLNELAASRPGFAGLSVAMQAELCFGQFLMADFNEVGGALLPPSIHTIQATELPGPFVLQVDEVINISNPLRERYHEKAAGPGRTLKLSMTDGVQRVSGMEYRPIRALQVLSPAGMKISLKNVCVRRGLLMLVPEVLEILGGVVERLESARLRTVQVVNKPPRGKRTRQGMVEPTLVERATHAAWAEGPEAPMENNRQSDQHTSHAVSSHAPGIQHSNSVTGRGEHHTVMAAVQQGEEHQAMQKDEPADSRGQSVHIEHSVRVASVQQYQPMQQDQLADSREQSAHIQHSVSVASVQQNEQYQPMQQDQPAESREQSAYIQHSVWVASVEQNEQHQPMQQDQSADCRRQSTHIQHSVRMASMQQNEQYQLMQQDQPAESREKSAHIQHFVRVASVQQNEQHQPMQRDQSADSRGQSAHIQHSVRVASAQQNEQHQPMQHDQSLFPSRQSTRVSEINSIGLETVQQTDHREPMNQEQVTESSRISTTVSGIHSVRLDTVHQVEQHQTPQQVQGAEPSRQSVLRTHDVPTNQVSSQSNGQPSSTPTLGRLSLSRRLTQSRLSFSPNVPHPQASVWPLQSPGADIQNPVELDVSQESEQHPVVICSTPPSKIDIFREKVPFNYLAVLKEKTNSQLGQNGVVRGKVKCVITGVVSFQYKDSDKFKLHVHIEDGSLITAAFVQHQLVQKLVGFSPKEVISGLQNPDTHQEMLANMLRFQKYLETFEGFMHVEFSESSSVPKILQMTEGVQSADVKLLLNRLHHSMNRQTPNNDRPIPTIDLSTP